MCEIICLVMSSWWGGGGCHHFNEKLLCMYISAEFVNCFKNRLDNFWKDQEIIYNFPAEIYGTGNRSEVTV